MFCLRRSQVHLFLALACATGTGLGLIAAEPTDAVRSGSPRLVLQSGHAVQVTATAFSPDGKLLASADANGVILLHHVDTLQLVRQWEALKTAVTALAWSPDGRHIAAACRDGSAGVYRADGFGGGTKFRGPGEQILRLHWLNDSDALVITASNGYRIVALSGGTHADFALENVTATALSDDSQFLAYYSGEKLHTVKVQTGEPVAQTYHWARDDARGLPLEFFPGSHDLPNFGSEISFRPFGSQSSGVHDRRIRIWSAQAYDFPETAIVASRLRLVAAGGTIFVPIQYSDGAVCIARYLPPTGQPFAKLERPYFLTKNDGWFRDWDKAETPLGTISFGPDGTKVAYAHRNFVKIADYGGGKATITLEPKATRVSQVYYHAAAKELFFQAGDTLCSWRIDTREFSRLELKEEVTAKSGDKYSRTRAALLPFNRETGQIMAFASIFRGLNILQMAAGMGEDVLDLRFVDAGSLQVAGAPLRIGGKFMGDDFKVAATSTNGRYILCSDNNGFSDGKGKQQRGVLIDSTRRQEVARLPILTGDRVAISGSGRHVAAAKPDAPTVRVYPVTPGPTNGAVQELAGHAGGIRALAFDPAGRHLAVADGTGRIRLWDVARRQVIRDLPAGGSSAEFLFWSEEGRLVIGFADGEVQLRTPLADDRVVSYRGHESVIRSATMMDGDGIATVDGSGLIHLWHAAEGRSWGKLAALSDGWIYVDADSRYDTNSVIGNTALSWVMPDDPFRALPIEIYQRQYFEPDLFRKQQKGEEIVTPPSLQSLNRAQPVTTIEAVTISPGEMELRVRVQKGEVTLANGKTMTSEAYDLRVFRDGRLIASLPDAAVLAGVTQLAGLDTDEELWRSATKIPENEPIPFRVRVPAGAGTTPVVYSAYAFNRDRVKGIEGRVAVTPPAVAARVRRAYLVLMGVSQTGDPGYNLAYPVDDVRLLQRKLGEVLRRPGIFTEVISIPLVTYAPDAGGSTSGEPRELIATKRNLATVLALLAGRPLPAADLAALPASLRNLGPVRPDDFFFFSISSHGVNTASDDLNLIPFDPAFRLVGMTGPEFDARCISGRELAAWLSLIDAAQFYVMIDACHAAAAIQGRQFKPAPLGGRTLGSLAFDKGMTILTATQGDNVAHASGHGLLSGTFAEEAFGLSASPAVDFSLVEAMRRTARRLPAVYRQLELAAPGKKAQESHLFDFAGTALSTIVLPPAGK